MKKYLIFWSIIFGSMYVNSQNIHCKSYDWATNPKPDTTTYDTSLHAVYTLKKMIKEFVYEDNKLVEYYLIHRKAKLLTDKAIEDFNTAYIPKYYQSENLIEKARVIKPNGQVINLPDSNIKEAIDEESNTKYRFFAFEGVELGSEIEYLYLIKKQPYYNGLYYTVQSKWPTYHFSFKLYAPTNLIFKFKSYNGLPDILQDTNCQDTNYWHVEVDFIPGLKKDKFSNYENNLMAFGFKLDKNKATGANDIVAYGPWAKRVYDAIYTLDKSQKKIIKKIIKDIKPDLSSEENTIRSVENYLKKNYAYYDISAGELSDIETIYKNKAFNRDGALFIYGNIFKQLGIKHDLIVTSDRWDLKFDPDFESNVYLDYFMFYFPNIKKILAPSNLLSRLGVPPQNYVNCYGLFIKEVAIGDMVSGIGKIQFINPIEMDKTLNYINVDVHFDKEFTHAILNTRQELTGYDAMYIQPVLPLIKDPKDLENFKKETVNIFDIDDEPEKYEYINAEGKYFGVKPLIITSTFVTEQLTEKAGKAYLFKVGRLIGPQMELYDEDDDRTQDFEFMYSRKYKRKLTIEIPDGYTVQNLDKLVFDKKYTNENGKTVFAFLSNYTIKDNKIIISMEEWYDGLNFKKEEWNHYKEVINAAANFNKISLLFKAKE